jgi:hypothetical protein
VDIDLDLDNIATAYLRNYHSSDKEKDFWAWEAVRTLVKNDIDAAWSVTLLLLEKAKSDDEVGYIAAGPLEDLIDMQGHAVLDRIEPACENNPRLRLALSTVGVLYYYDEFDRCYGLLYKYGFKEDRVAGSLVIEKVMKIMQSLLDGTIGIYEYGYKSHEILDKPFDDKAAQRLLQKRCWDAELLDAKRPPDYREPYLTRSEFRANVASTLAELNTLGYQVSSESSFAPGPHIP